MDQFRDDIDKLIETKKQLAELVKKNEKYRDSILSYMSDNSLSSIEHRGELMKKTNCKKETIKKEDLPTDIWDKYCTISHYKMLSFSKIKEKDQTKKLS